MCAVSGCSKSAEKHVRTLHEFPMPRKDSLATVNAWRQFVCRTRADWKGVTKWSRICSEHFEEKCYVNWTAWRMKAADKLHLRTDQVPTRYPGRSPPEQNMNVARGRPPAAMFTDLAAGGSQTCRSPSLDNGGGGGGSVLIAAGKVVAGPPASLLGSVTSEGRAIEPKATQWLLLANNAQKLACFEFAPRSHCALFSRRCRGSIGVRPESRKVRLMLVLTGWRASRANHVQVGGQRSKVGIISLLAC